MGKALKWTLIGVVVLTSQLLGFATIGVVPTLLLLVPIWLIVVHKTGSGKRWKDGTTKLYQDGVRIQQEQAEAERQARIAELERELATLKR